VIDVTRCSNCEEEDREGGQFCEACGNRIEPKIAGASLEFARMDTDTGSSDSVEPEVAGLVEPPGPSDSVEPEVAGLVEPPGPTDSTEPSSEGLVLSTQEDEASADSPETGGSWSSEGWPEAKDDEASAADSTETEDAGVTREREAEAPSARAGYLVFPDNTEQPIPPSQWLIGRADLAKYLSDPEKAPEISRGHLTVFQEGEKFFIEDGKTMVQDKPSSNKTWLVREGNRILVTGTGRNELQDDDEIDVAELVKLQFVEK